MKRTSLEVSVNFCLCTQVEIYMQRDLFSMHKTRINLWGWSVPKPSFEIWDTEITFGWSVVEAIASFQWSTSLSKCKCSHAFWMVNFYIQMDTDIWMVNFYIQMDTVVWMVNFISECKCNHLNGEFHYPNVNAVIWMVNFYIQMDTAIWIVNLLWGCSIVPRLIQIPLRLSLGTRLDQWSDWCARTLHRIVSDLATYVDGRQTELDLLDTYHLQLELVYRELVAAQITSDMGTPQAANC